MPYTDTEDDRAFKKSLAPIPYVPPPVTLPTGLRFCIKCAFDLHPSKVEYAWRNPEECAACAEPEGGPLKELVAMARAHREAHFESEFRRYGAIKDSIDRDQAYWKALDAKRAARRALWCEHLFGLLLIGSIVATAIYLSLNGRIG